MTLNPTVDICLEVDELRAEGKNRARVRSVRPGGGGINVARCLRRLGGTATAVYAAGGETGLRLGRLLAAENLDGHSIGIAGETREALVVTETRAQHSYHIVPPGPSMTEAEVAEVLAAIHVEAAHCCLVVVTGSVPPGVGDEFTAAVVQQARAHRIPALLDVTGGQLRHLRGADVFLIRLDRKEAAGLIGHPIVSFADARRANRRLLESGSTRHAITTVGALGAAYSELAADHEISAPPLPGRPRSDACAGDSLMAAVTYRIARGDRCLSACEYGVAAAAATVSLPGTEVFEPAAADVLVGQVRTRTVARVSDSAAPQYDPAIDRRPV
ncbi:1-phosphofructokinase family hexose kinase [Nocardia sp. NPDC003963]